MENRRPRFNKGIRGKLFLLILITLLLVVALFIVMTAFRNEIIEQRTTETRQKQILSMSEITSSVMTDVTRDRLIRNTELEAMNADDFFSVAKSCLLLLNEKAVRLYTLTQNYTPKAYTGPDPDLDGMLSAMVIPAPGVDPDSPEFVESAGLVANMIDVMLSICDSYDLDNAYIATEEGVFLSVSRDSGTWFNKDGTLLEYDARTRFWYQQAAEAKKLIFTDVERDANTGNLSLVCALPVYDLDGNLKAVLGMDLFMGKIQESLKVSEQNGGYHLIVNRDGHVVASTMRGNEFQAQRSKNAVDLRQSSNLELGAFIREAMDGRTEVRLVHLGSGAYYMVGAPVKTAGWTLISLFSEDKVNAPAAMLRDTFDEIEENAANTYDEKTQRLNWIIGIVMTVMLLALCFAALLMGKRIIRPLNRMTEQISELKEDHLDFRMEDEYRTGDEVEILAESFAMITRKTNEYVEQVRTVTAEKERISAELNTAAMIQSSMLPHLFPPFPDRKEFDLYASMDPAKAVGGDFYDFFLVDPDHLYVLIADVSGKGIPGALFMMTSKVILQNCAMLGISPAQILAKANEAICANNQAELFVTAWVGILEISTGKLRAANAGHEFPAISRAGEDFALFKDKHSFVIGGMPGVQYNEYELQLQPGDRLFFYTDGIPEASNAENGMFGTDRMITALNLKKDAGPEEILGNVRGAVDEFVKDAEQFDDMTMLCLEYNGPVL